MAIKYSIYDNPPRRDGKKPERHIQVKNLKPVGNYDIAGEMKKINPLYSRGTSVGTLLVLRDAIEQMIADGCSIHLDGIGTFTPKVSADITTRADRQGRQRLHTTNLKVTGIDFQPDEGLLDDINSHAQFEWVAGVRTTPVSDEELRAVIDRHFAKHDTLTRAELMEALNISKDRARLFLNKLVADGTLRKEGVRATTRYMKV